METGHYFIFQCTGLLISHGNGKYSIILYYLPGKNFLLFCSEMVSISLGVKFFTYDVTTFVIAVTYFTSDMTSFLSVPKYAFFLC